MFGSNIYIYSSEPSFEGVYTRFLNLSNGVLKRLVNINRLNRYTKVYFKFYGQGKMYLNLYRGYYDNGVLNYKLSNHKLIDVELGTHYVLFQDFTDENLNYINYYIEVEAIEDIQIRPDETGVYFDDILLCNNIQKKMGTGLALDINSNPLTKQIFTEVAQFNLVVNAAAKNQVLNITEKPFYFVYETGCLEYTTNLLSLKNISMQYVSRENKYMSMTIISDEEI